MLSQTNIDQHDTYSLQGFLKVVVVEDISLRVHVPKWYILRAQSTDIGTTLRPMYLRYEHMDPEGFICFGIVGTGRLWS